MNYLDALLLENLRCWRIKQEESIKKCQIEEIRHLIQIFELLLVLFSGKEIKYSHGLNIICPGCHQNMLGTSNQKNRPTDCFCVQETYNEELKNFNTNNMGNQIDHIKDALFKLDNLYKNSQLSQFQSKEYLITDWKTLNDIRGYLSINIIPIWDHIFNWFNSNSKQPSSKFKWDENLFKFAPRKYNYNQESEWVNNKSIDYYNTLVSRNDQVKFYGKNGDVISNIKKLKFPSNYQKIDVIFQKFLEYISRVHEVRLVTEQVNIKNDEIDIRKLDDSSLTNLENATHEYKTLLVDKIKTKAERINDTEKPRMYDNRRGE